MASPPKVARSLPPNRIFTPSASSACFVFTEKKEGVDFDGFFRFQSPSSRESASVASLRSAQCCESSFSARGGTQSQSQVWLTTSLRETFESASKCM